MNDSEESSLCPSYWSDAGGSVLFGIVQGTPEQPRMIPLKHSVPLTPELVESAKPWRVEQIYRLAGPCAKKGCAQFDGSTCTLGQRLVETLEPASDTLPPCPIRSRCRWWSEQGADACSRCSQVVTLGTIPTLELRYVATPPGQTAIDDVPQSSAIANSRSNP